MILDNLTITNIGSFKNSTYTFQDGLWLVEGINEDKEKNSNGSGKSIFFIDSLTWLLFEQTCRGVKHNDIIRNNEKMGEVIGEFNNKKIIIKRTKQRNKESILTLNNSIISQKELECVIGMSFTSFITAIIHPQSTKNFIDLTENEQKTILTEILNLDFWDKCKEQAEKEKKIIEKEIISIETQLNMLNNMKEELEKTNFENVQKEFEEKQKFLIQKNENEILNYNKQIQELEEEIKNKEIFIKEKNKIKELINDSIKKINELEIINKKLKNEDNENNKILYSLEGLYKNIIKNKEKIINLTIGKCPLCFSLITEQTKEKCLIEIDNELQEIQQKMQPFKEISNKINEKTIEVNNKINKYKDSQEKNTLLLNKIEKEIKNIENIKNMILLYKQNILKLQKNIEEIKKEKNPIIYLKENKKQKLKEINDKIDKLTKEHSNITMYANYIDFWYNGFGNKGIKSYILDSIIPELTEKTNKYIQILSEDNITINFDTQKEKRTGGFSEKFNIILSDINGSRTYNAWSGGEKKRIAIAIDLALSDLILIRNSNIWDFQIFDEVLDGLDETGKILMIHLLNEIMNERKRIYIISHDATIKGMIDNKIKIIKKEGVSYIEQ